MRFVHIGIFVMVILAIPVCATGQEPVIPDENAMATIENERTDESVDSGVQELVIEEEIRVRGTIEKPGVLYLIPQKRELFESEMNEPGFDKQLSRLRYSTVIPNAHLLEVGGTVSASGALEGLSPGEESVSKNRSLTEALSRKLKEK